jgi:zinc protease
MSPHFPQPLSIDNIPVLVETSKAIPLVHISVALRRGAAADPKGGDGLTRLTSRLMRRTAGGIPLPEIERRLDRLGISLGADTSYSNVSIVAAVLKRSCESCIPMLADTLGKPGLSDVEFGRLKRETLAEIVEGQDNDRGLASRALRRSLFSNHAYGRSVGGTINTVKSLEPEQARSLYRTLVQKDDLLIGISGDIEQDEALRFAERLVQSVAVTAKSTEKTEEPAPGRGRKLVFVNKPERTQTQIYVGLQGSHPKDDDHLDLHVANTVFGGMFSSRLMQQIRVKRGWSYGAYSSLPLDRHRQAFTIWTFPKSEDTAACLKLELEMLEDWVTKGITEKELRSAKNMLTRSYAFLVDTASKRLGLCLDEILYDLPKGYYAAYPKKIAAIRLEDVNAALRRRLNPAHLVVAVVGTTDRVLSDVQAVMPDAETEVIPFDTEDL